ncbi:MAG TPA: endonuclease III [Phycisphaerae bacterium]|nr:endonuclease III [Phycisphaerae bacterium]
MMPATLHRPHARTHAPAKRPFDIHKAIPLLREAVEPFPAAAMFELRDKGYSTLFQQLIACIISIRTRDEVSLPTAIGLFEKAATPHAIADLTVTEIDQLIHAATFHYPKAKTIHDIARKILSDFHGHLPPDRDILLALPGVGPKCASLALGVAEKQPHISVDIHVHRVTNRWGYIHAKTPEKTMLALMEKLPEEFWIELNRLLVPFGKHICTAAAPRCSTCPLLSMCQQIGVTSHR